MILSNSQIAKSVPTFQQKRDVVPMNKRKKRRKIKLLAVLFSFIIAFSAVTTVVYANKEEKVNIHIITTQTEFKKLYEWFLKDKYDVSVEGELSVRAYIKDQVPVNTIEENRGQGMLLAENIVKFFSDYWIYIVSGLGLVFVIIFIRAKRRSCWNDDDYYSSYYYYGFPFQYKRNNEQNETQMVNLHQRLSIPYSQPSFNYYTNNYYNNDPYVAPVKDYSMYDDRHLFTLIRQKSTYRYR
jgi:hypothetical protein